MLTDAVVAKLAEVFDDLKEIRYAGRSRDR
jgi:hypothetical protein